VPGADITGPLSDALPQGTGQSNRLRVSVHPLPFAAAPGMGRR